MQCFVASAAAMRVTIRDSYGKLEVPLELAPAASVSDVKAGLAQRLALPPSAAAAPNAIRLIFAGKLLVDGAILREAVAREVRAALPAAPWRV